MEFWSVGVISSKEFFRGDVFLDKIKAGRRSKGRFCLRSVWKESCLKGVWGCSLHSGGREVVRVGNCLYQANFRSRQPYFDCRFMTDNFTFNVINFNNIN